MIPFHDHFVHKVYFIEKETFYLEPICLRHFFPLVMCSDVCEKKYKSYEKIREKIEKEIYVYCLLKHGVDTILLSNEN